MPLLGCTCTCRPVRNIPVRNVNLVRLDSTAGEPYTAIAIVHTELTFFIIVHVKHGNFSSTGNSIQIQLTGQLRKIGDKKSQSM